MSTSSTILLLFPTLQSNIQLTNINIIAFNACKVSKMGRNGRSFHFNFTHESLDKETFNRTLLYPPPTAKMNFLPFSHLSSRTRLQTLCDNLNTLPIQPRVPDLPSFGTPLYSFRTVSQDEVIKIMKSMSFKTCELDPLPASLYLGGFPQLLPFITDLTSSTPL